MLIKCPECGKEVSDTCEQCVHCGYVLKKNEKDLSFIGHRGSAGSFMSFFIINLSLSLIFICGFIALLISFLVIKEPPLLITGIVILLIGLIPFTSSLLGLVKNSKNNKIREPIIEYKNGEDVFHLTDYKGHKYDIAIKDHVEVSASFFTGNSFYFKYRNENNKLVTIDLGYCSNRSEVKHMINQIVRNNNR